MPHVGTASEVRRRLSPFSWKYGPLSTGSRRARNLGRDTTTGRADCSYAGFLTRWCIASSHTFFWSSRSPTVVVDLGTGADGDAGQQSVAADGLVARCAPSGARS